MFFKISLHLVLFSLFTFSSICCLFHTKQFPRSHQIFKKNLYSRIWLNFTWNFFLLYKRFSSTKRFSKPSGNKYFGSIFLGISSSLSFICVCFCKDGLVHYNRWLEAEPGYVSHSFVLVMTRMSIIFQN